MQTSTDKTIAILGFSDKPTRYSYKAHQMLLEYGFTHQIGITAKKLTEKETIFNHIELVSTIADIQQPIDTLTLYIGIERLTPLIHQILALSPRRIITNPGTENRALINQAREQGIEVVEGCTLVMLRTGGF
ncbi:CoA-binding protein [Vibrio sp. SS-MA-C1-2]|uniref:CoA-binding protein n=1 Tax=Vibrio sp. SS-MA-C1-2 TaxID=2908646 RepID=UPI001F2E5CDC|nr:CoA-binding protein [Vibrio sp. SS-MA-C1-2]UJF18731.1 CoA-binding protein [Vibrio sp. SS-MA-C1-2]